MNYWIGLADLFKKKKTDADLDNLKYGVNEDLKENLKNTKRKSGPSADPCNVNLAKKMKTTIDLIPMKKKKINKTVEKDIQGLNMIDADETEDENLKLEDDGFNWDATPADLAKVISGNVEEDELSEVYLLIHISSFLFFL